MAVSLLDTPSSQETGDDPPTFSVSVGSNRWLILMTAIQGALDTMDSVTYGGQAMTKIADSTEVNARRVYIWGLNDAGITAASDGDFVASYTGSPAAARISHAVVSIQGADQTAPTETATAAATANPIEATLAGENGAFGVAMVRANDVAQSWGWNNDWTEIFDTTTLTGNDDSAGYKAFIGAGNQIVSVGGSNQANMLLAARFSPVSVLSSIGITNTGPAGLDVIYDGELRVDINGSGFGATAGTVKLHDSDPSEGTPAISVTQTQRAWGDSQVNIDIDKGALTSDAVWLEVTHNDTVTKAVQSIIVKDNPAGVPKTRANPASQSFTFGEAFSFDIKPYFYDSNSQETLTFSSPDASLVAGLSIIGDMLQGNISSGADVGSPYTTTIRATDTDGNTVEDTFTHTIGAAGQAVSGLAMQGIPSALFSRKGF